MGALHIEHTAQLMVGKYLGGSEWDWVLAKAEVFTSGHASSALNDQVINHTRYCHQVTLVSLTKLRLEAYTEYLNSASDAGIVPHSYDIWCETRHTSGDTHNFAHWSGV